MPQSHELLPNILDVLESIVWVLAQQFHYDVDHIIRKNVVFEEGWHLVDVTFWSILVESIVIDELNRLLTWWLS